MIRILQQITTFSNFQDFSKIPSVFFKKPKFWTFWEILLFQSHSTANLLQVDEKNDIQAPEQPMLARLRELNWQISGKKNAPIWQEDFAFHIFNMVQSNKDSR